MAYGNNTNLGESPTEGAADLSTDIPYTTAATDFIRTSPIAENLKLQEIDYAATDFLSLKNSLIKYIKAIYPRDFQNFNESESQNNRKF